MVYLCAQWGGHQDRPYIVRTAAGRFFVAWLDYRGDFGDKSVDAIFCQKLIWMAICCGMKKEFLFQQVAENIFLPLQSLLLMER